MTTPTHTPLFLGTLSIEPPRRPTDPPQLYLSFRCAFCRRAHHHRWGDPAPEPTHRAAHCSRPGSPYVPGGYRIFPESTPENAAVIRRYRDQVAAARTATAPEPRPPSGLSRCV